MNGLTITAAGMVTSLGFNAPATCAAIRAGIRNVAETNLWDKYSGSYLGAGRVALPHWWVGLGKLADLVAPAIRECLDAAKAPAEAIPVLLGVSGSDRPFRFDGLDDRILSEIEDRLGLRLHHASRVIANDHVAAVVGLRAAHELISKHGAPYVVVAAVDSLVDQRVVEHYLEKRRLLTPLDSNGFSVGEAGAAVLVAPGREQGEGGLTVLATSVGFEPATIESEDPLRGDGMTAVIREALAEADRTIQDVHYRLADLNGEHYKFKEMVLAMGRFSRKPTPKLFDVWHPIEYIGDVGAAIGPLLLGLALHAGRGGYGNGPTVLSTLANDNGARAAVVTHFEAAA